jgi:Sulfotransferase family
VENQRLKQVPQDITLPAGKDIHITQQCRTMVGRGFDDAVFVPKAGLAADFKKFWRRLSPTSAESSPSLTFGTYPAQESVMQRARDFFCAEDAKDTTSLVARKAGDIRRFDLTGMHRVVAICAYGRSGSVLLASYFDGHEDVVTLPHHLGGHMYPFFERYQSLCLRDKLIAYPFISVDNFEGFFEGETPVAAADYYAAVNALFEVWGNLPTEFLESRRAFVQLLHVVYSVAHGLRPKTANPLIVYVQLVIDNLLANRLVEDFPQARFIHTLRDPITNCGRFFTQTLKLNGIMAAGYVISHLTFADKPHAGMESRTMPVRFEDMHLHLEETMRALADWLALSYRPALLDSTFNGIPLVAGQGTVRWSGARPEQALRDSKNVSFTDRCILYSVLNEDFVAWNYPCPKIFRYPLARLLTCTLFLPIPMKIEIIAARTLTKSFKSEGFRVAINKLGRICICRVAIMTVLAVELYRRLVFGKRVLAMR